MSSSSETETYDFVLTKESKSFTNVSSSALITDVFTDVSADAWYYEDVARAYREGLVQGVSEQKFAPDAKVRGAEFLTMLYRADGNLTSEPEQGNWYDEAVQWAESHGVILTDNGWEFDAEADLSREQMMVLIYRYLCDRDVQLTAASDLASYSDNGSVSDYAKEAVQYLVGEGLIVGDGQALRPQDGLTRAESVTILLRALDRINPQAGGEQNPSQRPPEGFGGSGTVTQGTSANTITEDGSYSGEVYSSTGDNENALRIDGAEATFSGITVQKTEGASSNTEDGDFYGQNAALLATNGATVTIDDATVRSSVTNGNGIFSYGNGTTVNVSDSVVVTEGDHSGGVHTTGGGTMNASNLIVETSGSSSAAIRTDRGGGTVTVNGGTYTTNGYNSPAIYSTADITASDCELIANQSEALVVEGSNSISLTNCTVSGNMSDTEGSSSDENVHNIMLYQSMSGDAEEGTSAFDMTGGTITSNNGDVIYVTNTHSVVTLSDVTIENNDPEGYLICVSGNSGTRGWGTAGANGGQLTFTASDQTLEGDIVVDTISTLTMQLTNRSTFSGTVNIIDNAQNGAQVAQNAVITIDEGCVWNLTGDCTMTSIENNGTINFNGYTITLADGTVLA